jgi:hypothetical protein
MYRSPQTLMEVLGAPSDLVLAHTKSFHQAGIAKEMHARERIAKSLASAEARDPDQVEMMELIMEAVLLVVTTSTDMAKAAGGVDSSARGLGGGGSGGAGAGAASGSA